MSTYLLDVEEGAEGSPSRFPEIPPEGLFGPDSVAWKINREQVTLLAGPAAAVLQIAHPKVARGVAEHSDFRQNSYGRLERTLAAVRTITFGTRRDVLYVAQHVQKMHARVMSDDPGRNGPYSAFDKNLQMWVLATLIKGAISAYEQFVGSLSVGEKEAYLQDMRIWGEFFGLDRNYGPQHWCEFEPYYNTMISGRLLGSDPICAEVAQRVVYPEQPFLFKVAVRPLSFLVTEMIPSPLLERLGLRSRPWTKAAWSITKFMPWGIFRPWWNLTFPKWARWCSPL